MFGRANLWIVLLTLAVLALALSTARPSRGAAHETRHVVAPGETLWELAVKRYADDPRAAVWRIEQRNGLTGEPLQPGVVLYLPP